MAYRNTQEQALMSERNIVPNGRRLLIGLTNGRVSGISGMKKNSREYCRKNGNLKHRQKVNGCEKAVSAPLMG